MLWVSKITEPAQLPRLRHHGHLDATGITVVQGREIVPHLIFGSGQRAGLGDSGAWDVRFPAAGPTAGAHRVGPLHCHHLVGRRPSLLVVSATASTSRSAASCVQFSIFPHSRDSGTRQYRETGLTRVPTPTGQPRTIMTLGWTRWRPVARTHRGKRDSCLTPRQGAQETEWRPRTWCTNCSLIGVS